MALDPKLLIVGAALAFLLGGKKSSGKNAGSSSNDDKKDISEEDKSDKGDPVGPNGCKTGLVEKDGYCVDPNDPNNGGKGNNGGSGSGKGGAAKAELTITKDCKSWSYGDKSGDAWWKAKGEPKAKQWIKAGYMEPLEIAYEMLKTTVNCFKDFPVREDFQNWYDYNLAKFEWINSNRPIWFLLYSVRNKIDLTQFNGVETVQTGPDLKLKFGPGFNYDKFWNSIKPMALALLELTASEPKDELNTVDKALGIKDINQGGYTTNIMNITTYMFTIIFPNIPVNEWVVKLSKGSLNGIPLWSQLFDSISDNDGESIDLDQDPEAGKF